MGKLKAHLMDLEEKEMEKDVNLSETQKKYLDTLKTHKKPKAEQKFAVMEFNWEARKFLLPYAVAVKITELIQDAIVYESSYSSPPKLTAFQRSHLNFHPVSANEMDDIRVAVLLQISEEKAREMRDGIQDIPF